MTLRDRHAASLGAEQMIFVRNLLFLFSFVLCACGEIPDIVSCGTGTEPQNNECVSTNKDGVFFSSLERTIILETLGSLSATAPAEQTNSVADSPAAAVLGQKLYFDKRYSSNGEVSCATCHDPAVGFQDARDNTSLGLGFTGRHAPTVINAAYGAGDGSTVFQFWDGRADSLWSQALGPPENDVEMGGTRTIIAKLIFNHYRSEYEAVFGDSISEPTAPDAAKPGTAEWSALSDSQQESITQIYVGFGKAIAAYERKIVSRNSRFDYFFDEIASGAEDSDHLSLEEKRGLRLFIGDANCVTCHRGSNFTNGGFNNIGVPQIGDEVPDEDSGRSAGISSLQSMEFHCASEWSDHPNKDECVVHGLEASASDVGAFKETGLRDVTKTAPYMHTGAMWTLEEVVEHYNLGGASSGFVGTKHPSIVPLNLSTDDKEDLIAFMRALDGAPIAPALLLPPQ